MSNFNHTRWFMLPSSCVSNIEVILVLGFILVAIKRNVLRVSILNIVHSSEFHSMNPTWFNDLKLLIITKKC